MQIHTIKVKNEKKESTFFWNCFAFIAPVPFFCIFNLKVCEQKDKIKNKIFKFEKKLHAKKGRKQYFKKSMQKKWDAKKAHVVHE